MEFNKRYNRTEFVDFLQYKFLPEDFVVEATSLDIERQTKYIYAQSPNWVQVKHSIW